MTSLAPICFPFRPTHPSNGPFYKHARDKISKRCYFCGKLLTDEQNIEMQNKYNRVLFLDRVKMPTKWA